MVNLGHFNQDRESGVHISCGWIWNPPKHSLRTSNCICWQATAFFRNPLFFPLPLSRTSLSRSGASVLAHRAVNRGESDKTWEDNLNCFTCSFLATPDPSRRSAAKPSAAVPVASNSYAMKVVPSGRSLWKVPSKIRPGCVCRPVCLYSTFETDSKSTPNTVMDGM